VAVANERRYREFVMCCCSHNRRGSSTRIVTNGHLRNLVPYRIGLLYTANSMGSKAGDETGKKERPLKNIPFCPISAKASLKCLCQTHPAMRDSKYCMYSSG
jgi:hypothetical protein